MWFLFCVALLIVGYFTYGKLIEKIFVINPKKTTPAFIKKDGVDYMPMSKKRIWLIQLLNIAGTGPIFGPILGALYGPVAMLWIVFGCIFAGAVHDYFCGMLSIRNGGASMPYLAGKYLGRPVKMFINIFSVVLLLLVGVVFVASPAQLLSNITLDIFGKSLNRETILLIWTTIIFIYYIMATLMPIDKIIGKIYPFFGVLLLFMSVSMVYGLFSSHLSQNDPIYFYRAVNQDGNGLTFAKFFENFQVKENMPIWPLLFLTISCGALSGFHATQTPLMTRCTENENEGRFIFYGAMIAEGVIALIWCAVGLSFYDSNTSLQGAISAGSPSKVVYDSALHFLGGIGGIIAVLGVVVLPITSGDTAFRSARLIIAEFIQFDQQKLINRLIVAVPLFVAGYIVSKTDFSDLWRYFTWANQITAMVMLWTAAGYLYCFNKFHWVATIPAIFISAVCFTYLFFHKIGFGLNYQLSVYLGLFVTAVCLILFFVLLKPVAKSDPDELANH